MAGAIITQTSEARDGIDGTRTSIRLARPSITNTRGQILGKDGAEEMPRITKSEAAFMKQLVKKDNAP